MNFFTNIYFQKMSSENLFHCKIHNKKYVGYCETCKLDICLLCTSQHEKHELLQYNEIQPSSKKVAELKEKFNEYKEQNKILISKMNLWLEKVNHYTNKIIEILENNEKIYESIFSNYDENNLVFKEIDNMNQIRKKGLILGYKNINLDLFGNEEKILEKSDLILKTIKEMQIEDIFFSIKNRNNVLNVEKHENINENEQKELEDKSEKKSNKKKKIKKAKNQKKDNENELLRKKFEDYKEVNLKSNYFDDEYLINLESSKKSKEDLKIDLNSENTESLNTRSIHNGREINNLSLIQNDLKKYIVTSGYCYINLFDLKGQLQRSIKLHDSDITNLIQLKNFDLVTSCIDGTMKITRLGKNEGYSVIQNIDTKQVKHENRNNIFSNNQLYVLTQIAPNEDLVTAHGDNILFYSKSEKNNEISYEFNQILPVNNEKKENDYDFILNNKNITSLLNMNNNNLIALNNNTIFFVEKNNDKYIINHKIKDICSNGGPNNISIYNNDIIIISGGNKIHFVNIKEKNIINEIKIDVCCINCINIKCSNNSLYIGCESKNNQFDIGIYDIINKENKYEINRTKVYQNVHNKSISNIIPINCEELEENKEDENIKIKLDFVSGSHDKYLKYWE